MIIPLQERVGEPCKYSWMYHASHNILLIAMGQFVRPEPGRGWTVVCCPVWLFLKVAPQVGLEDEDRQHFVFSASDSLKLPDK